MELRGFYAILNVAPGTPGCAARPDASLSALEHEAELLLAAAPCMLQLRAKGACARDLAVLARRLLPLARAVNVPLCVNDRLDVALAVGADAVHLGQDDVPLAEALRVAAGRLTIGISTHNLTQVREALAGGANYVGFGPIFETDNKENPDPVVGLSLLRQAADEIAARIPLVAIGGIDLAQVGAVASTGASAAAVIGAVRRSADITAAGKRINAVFVKAAASG